MCTNGAPKSNFTPFSKIAINTRICVVCAHKKYDIPKFTESEEVISAVLSQEFGIGKRVNGGGMSLNVYKN